MNLKKHLFTTLLVAGVASVTSAQSTDWTGLYLGVNAGYAYGKSNTTTTTEYPKPSDPGAYFTPFAVLSINAAGSGSLNPKSFTGGVTLGYNTQSGTLVYGGEVDMSAFSLKGERSVSFVVPYDSPYTRTIQQATKADYLMTLRGRAGYAHGRALWFATAGLAMTAIRVEHSFSDTMAAEHISTSKTKLGWAFGAGYEYRLPNQWAFKGELLHVDFGEVTTAGGLLTIISPGTPPAFPQHPFTHSASLKANILRVGLSHKF